MNQAPPHPGAIDFSARILRGRKTAAGIRVPDDVAKAGETRQRRIAKAVVTLREERT